MNIFGILMLPVNAVSVFRQLASMEKYRKSIDKLRETATPAEVRQYIGTQNSALIKQIVSDFNLNIEVIGRDKVPQDKGCVFISNHQGYLDVVAILYALEDKQAGFIAKEEIRKVPFLGKWIESVGGFYIERGNPRSSLKAFKECWKRLKSGDSMVIFPEGTRSKGPIMGEYKQAAFKLATGGRTGAPIVPIVVDGTYLYYEKPGYLKTNVAVPITVEFLDPIYVDDLTKDEIKELPDSIIGKTRQALTAVQEKKCICENAQSR